MTKNIFRMGAVIAMAGVISSCGGSGGQPLQGNAVSFVLGNFNSVVVTQLPTSNSVPTLPGNGGLSTASVGGVIAMAAGTCETITPNPTIDGDGDNIAKTKSSVFNCTDLTSGGTTYSRTGTMTVTDGNDAVAGMLGGMRIDFALEKFNYSSGTAANEGSYSGFWNYTSNGTSLNSKSEFAGHLKYDVSTDASYSQDYDYTYTWDWTHTPDNSAAAAYWLAGAVEFSGTYSLDGKFTIDGHSGLHTSVTGKFVVNYYSKSLRFESGCALWFKSGSIFVDDSNGNLFETRYNCATAQLYVNGVASSVWAP